MEKNESRIQQDIVRHYLNAYCLKHHNPRCMILSIPNEGRGANSAALMATGLYSGAADLLIVHRRDHLGINIITRWLFVEVKTPTGTQKPKQKEFEQHCAEMCVQYHLVRSLEDFMQLIENL